MESPAFAQENGPWREMGPDSITRRESLEYHGLAYRYMRQRHEDKPLPMRIATSFLCHLFNHPFSFTKVLYQLGYYPHSGVTETITSRGFAVFYPPGLSYLYNIYSECGLVGMYRGVEASIAADVLGGWMAHATHKYVNDCLPNFGGMIELDTPESHLSHSESLEVRIRRALRDSICRTVGIVCSRPFVVVMSRMIAQYAGHEEKYTDLISALFCVGDEEGMGGLWAGLVPHLLAEYVMIWGVTSVRYLIHRFIEEAKFYDEQELEHERDPVEDNASTTSVSDIGMLDWMTGIVVDDLVPLMISYVAYPFRTVSTIMAVQGSNLIISKSPFTPRFSTWTDAYKLVRERSELVSHPVEKR